MWIKRFTGHQGFKDASNILYQDKKSTIQLQNNGKESSEKQTRRFDINFFVCNRSIQEERNRNEMLSKQ